MERILEGSDEPFDLIDKKYNFTIRINAERVVMKYSVRNIVNSNVERYEQYGHPLYKGWIDVKDDAWFETIYPGVNTKIFHNRTLELDKRIEQKIFEKYPDNHLPWIILSSRIDAKKNHISVLKAYAESKKLQEVANVFIVTRGIDDVFKSDSSKGDKDVLSNIVKLIQEKNIRNKVLFFNIEGQRELAALYRIGVKRNSVFVLSTIHEPFGLAIIEALACGLPVVATKYGGPVEILREGTEDYGILIDPLNTKEIGERLLDLILSHELYRRFSKKGISRVLSKFTWESAAEKYLNIIEENVGRSFPAPEIPSYFLNGEGTLSL